MNISLNNSPFSIFAQRFGNGLKSTQEKIERQQKMQSQVDFFEGQKAGLKNMQCDTMEEIAKKLELFNNYEAQIAAVKKQYNQEQMMHCMDEAQERGEKLAEAVKKLEPKTAEERREEMAEEALGVEEEGGMLTEMLDELPDLEEIKESLDELLPDSVEEELEAIEDMNEMTESMEALAEDSVLSATESMETLPEDSVLSVDAAEKVIIAEGTGSAQVLPEIVAQEKLTQEYLKEQYIPFDRKV